MEYSLSPDTAHVAGDSAENHPDRSSRWAYPRTYGAAALPGVGLSRLPPPVCSVEQAAPLVGLCRGQSHTQCCRLPEGMCRAATRRGVDRGGSSANGGYLGGARRPWEMWRMRMTSCGPFQDLGRKRSTKKPHSQMAYATW